MYKFVLPPIRLCINLFIPGLAWCINLFYLNWFVCKSVYTWIGWCITNVLPQLVCV